MLQDSADQQKFREWSIVQYSENTGNGTVQQKRFVITLDYLYPFSIWTSFYADPHLRWKRLRCLQNIISYYHTRRILWTINHVW